MKVLIVGGGGREHALAWKSVQSERVSKVFVAPGNAGTALEENIENVNIAADDIQALIKFAQTEQIELTIVGPEVPLVAGIVDQFSALGLHCFGPTQAAAQLEGSKAFAKDFLKRHHIPTAAYGNFTDIKQAKEYVTSQQFPIVIKADGLAAGKGVIIAETEIQAFNAIEDMLESNRFGKAGSRVVIEEFLQGEEASFIVMVDGENILEFATSQDHKARDNGDLGPNTGGMGAYSPAPVVTDEIHQTIMDQVIRPTVKGMKQEGNPFTGFLYAGVMINPQGEVKVLEYNCRFGDPETQPIMMRLNSDLIELCQKALKGELNTVNIEFDSRCALGVVLAAKGYPARYPKGDIISGLNETQDGQSKIFHAGTASKNDQIVTHGGRVLCVTALGDTVSEAQKASYQRVKDINWEGVFYRTDIGYRAVAREQ